MSGFCWDEFDHRRDAQRDARYHQPDRDYYDPYTSDPCKEAYTETYDREIREERRRDEERQEQEEQESRMVRRHQQEREMEEQHEEWPEEPFPIQADGQVEP